MSLTVTADWVASPDGFYWHCTTVDRLRRIRREGLLPGRKPRWVNGLGQKMGDRSVHLCATFHVAVVWGSKMTFDWQAEVVLLKLATPEVLVPDVCLDAEWNGRTFWKTPYAVPSERILRMVPLTTEMTRGLVSAVREGRLLAEPVAQEAA